jgi:hypothetical protein
VSNLRMWIALSWLIKRDHESLIVCVKSKTDIDRGRMREEGKSKKVREWIKKTHWRDKGVLGSYTCRRSNLFGSKS